MIDYNKAEILLLTTGVSFGLELLGAVFFVAVLVLIWKRSRLHDANDIQVFFFFFVFCIVKNGATVDPRRSQQTLILPFSCRSKKCCPRPPLRREVLDLPLVSHLHLL